MESSNDPKLTYTNVIIFFIGVLLGMAIIDLIQRSGIDSKQVVLPDTTYNQVKLDSIRVNIGKHDTLIYRLNIKLKDDVQRSYQLDDSGTVQLFKELVSE